MLWLFALFLGVSGTHPVAAQPAGSSPAYTVRDVAVDRTAATAAAARDAALIEGQRVALRRVLERLAPRTEYRRLPTVSDARISDLLENLEIQEERRSTVRYIARLTFRFRAEDIRTLLRNANIPFAETVAKPSLVLPVLRRDGLVLLWDEPNAWRDAWNRMSLSDGLAPLLLPRGDLADISDINALQASRGEDRRIAAIAGRYGVTSVVVAEATLDTGTAGRPVLQVSVGRYGGAAPDQTVLESYVADANEDEAALMQRAVVATARAIEERWKNEQLLQFGREGKLTVLVTYGDVRDWAAIQKRLGEMTQIRGSEIVTLTRSEAVLNLMYFGEESQLRLAMAQRDLELSPASGTLATADWRLTLAPSASVVRPRR
jgi:hypothetical protein